MNLKKILYILLGCAGLGLGAVGAVLPLLPSFPFLLLAAFCFARSSQRLHGWFVNTRLYKDNLESYVAGKGMTRKTKIRIMVTVTVLMAIGFVMMDAVPVGRLVLGGVWVFHLLYFSFGVKTLPASRRQPPEAIDRDFRKKRREQS
ncbi:MAG: YbaN family protein [Gemmiger sp.]